MKPHKKTKVAPFEGKPHRRKGNAKAKPSQKTPRRARGGVRLDLWLDAAHGALLTALAEKHGGNATETVKEALACLFVGRVRLPVDLVREATREISTGTPSPYFLDKPSRAT